MTRSTSARPAISLTAALVALVLTAASCSSGGDPVAADPTPPPTEAPTTTAAPTATSEPPPPPTWPLTGLALDDPAAADHPAVVVKIDNSADARPHVGLNQADVVYEVWVEGITRFAAVFHTQAADPVGPVRSARSTDIDLVGNLGRPLLVWSGGNPGVTGQVKAAEAEGVLVDVSHSVASPQYWRQSGRRAPHNLFTNVSDLLATRTPEGATPPTPLFAYRDEGAPAETGDAVPGVRIDYGLGSIVDYVWDGERSCWARYQDGAFVDEAGQQVCPANVVVMQAQYGSSEVDARSPQAYTVGDGEAFVLTDGHLVTGRWARGDRAAPATLTTADGAGIGLTRGTTWVAVPKAGSPVGPLAPEQAAALAAG